MIALRAMTWLLVAALACPAPSRADADAPGAFVAAERVKRYTALWFRIALRFADVPGEFPVHTGARLYRVSYWTRDHRGEAALATGLVAVPGDRRLRGIVGYLHGTTTERSYVPSTPNVEGKLAAAVFAGAGYLVVAPDYLGLGGSTALHPYLHAASAVDASIDLLRAVQTFCTREALSCPRTVNLLGVSQGGHAAVALHRHLESVEAPPFAAGATAVVGAPLDLAHISFPFALARGSKAHRVYLTYLVNAYASIYGEPLASVFREPYASRVPGLFDGHQDSDAIDAALTKPARAMFRTDFLEAWDAGKKTWLLEALEQNEVWQFAPRAPLRLYYGNLDEDVTPQDSVRSAAAMTRRGGNASAIAVGDVDHAGAALIALGDIRAWFDARTPR